MAGMAPEVHSWRSLAVRVICFFHSKLGVKAITCPSCCRLLHVYMRTVLAVAKCREFHTRALRAVLVKPGDGDYTEGVGALAEDSTPWVLYRSPI
jgi:hypothetical protein